MKTELRQGDVLMTSEAPLGELFYLCGSERYCLSQRLFAIRANHEVISPVILYLSLASNQTQHEIQSRASGATVSGIRQSELRNIPILVPPRQIQNFAEPILQNFAEQAHIFSEKNRTLIHARDLLQNRLISNQSIVEGILS